jgi:hypothetical protein
VPVGFMIWLLLSFRLHLLITQSYSFKWFAINQLVDKPVSIVITQMMTALIGFLMIQKLTVIIIASTLVIIFSSGFDLFKLIFELYLVYFMFPFIWSWLTGLSISLIYIYCSLKKTILFSISIILWVIIVFSLEYGLKSFNLFMENRWPYIDPVHNLSFLRENITLKVVYILTSLAGCLIFFKCKRSFNAFSVCLILFSLLTFFTHEVTNRTTIDEILMANDYKLYKEIENNAQDNINLSSNWRITKVKVDPSFNHPIEIELTLDKEEDIIQFALNNQFSIAQIKNKEKKLPFKQKGSVVEVYTGGAESMTLYYQKTSGTSFYPFIPNMTILPFEANWYPQSTVSNHYMIDSLGTLHTNIDPKSCTNIEIVIGKGKFVWEGNNLDCLSIIKGPFELIKIKDTSFYIYKPFLTKRKNYIKLQEQLLLVQNELCRLFDELKDGNYCTTDIEAVTVIPKSLGTTPLSLYDCTVTNGNYTFYVNLFLDVNYKPVTDHIAELSTFLIPYRLLDEEELSILISHYLIEIMDIEPIGYLDWIKDDHLLSSIDSIEYSQLTTEEKKIILEQKSKEMRHK